MPAPIEIAPLLRGRFRQRQPTWEELTDPQKWPPSKIARIWHEQNSTTGAIINIIKSHYGPDGPFNRLGVAEVVGDFLRRDLVIAAINRSKIVHKNLYVQLVRLRTKEYSKSHAISLFRIFGKDIEFSEEHLQHFLEAAEDAARDILQIGGQKLEDNKQAVRFSLA